MDPLGLVEGALTPLQRVRDAIKGMKEVKANLRQRYADYASIIEPLKRKPDVIAATGIKRELEELTELFTRVDELISEYTAAPTDGRLAKINTKAKRAAYWKDVEKELGEIDAGVMRQLATMNLKGAISSSETSSEMKALLEQIKALITDRSLPSLEPIMKLLNDMRPPSLPDMAAVPAEALTLPRSYVERAGVGEAVGALVDPEMALAPYTVVGMGGGGKTMLVSALVRNPRVREHFRRGIFWTLVGRGAKNNLLSLLQDLARKVAATLTGTPHVLPRDLDSVDKVQQYLATVASESTAAGALVVLDDVWERQVVDAFLLLGLKILVTTRDRSVVGVPGGLLELGDMAEDEALDLLLKSSMAVGKPRADVRTHMAKVIERCGRLPLLLAIAGSMPVVRGKGLKADAWEDLAHKFKNEATKMEESGEGFDSLEVVLVASFSTLAARKRKELLTTAVLAPGAVAPIEMLLNLWEMEDMESTREEADGLVTKCLVQDVGGGAYRVHDLVLGFVKIKISSTAHEEMRGKATALQAKYLARLDVVASYHDPKHGAGYKGFYLLNALWRSVEELSANLDLEVASYRSSLGELESYDATDDAAGDHARDVSKYHACIGRLYTIQEKSAEAEQLFERSQTSLEKIFGPEDPDLPFFLYERAELLRERGEYTEAEALCEQAQAILEKTGGPETRDVAMVLTGRARSIVSEGDRWAEADLLYVRAATILEKVDHLDLVVALAGRATLLDAQGQHEKADPLWARTLAITEEAVGPEHQFFAVHLFERANALSNQGKYDEADQMYLRAIEISEEALGPNNTAYASFLHSRALSLEKQGKNAEHLYLQAMKIWEATVGPEDLLVGNALHARALLLFEQDKLEDADALFVRALHPEYTSAKDQHLQLFRKQRAKGPTIEEIFRSQAIQQEKDLGPDHPDLAKTLHDLARVLQSRGIRASTNEYPLYTEKDDNKHEADLVYLRAIEIAEKAWGPTHENVRDILKGRCDLKLSMGRLDEADLLIARLHGTRWKSSTATPHRSGSSKGVTVAGAVGGAAMAGAVAGGLAAGGGAVVGAVALRAASKRDDGIGKAAKKAGAAADVAMEKAKALERDLEVSRKAKAAAGKAKQAAQKFDSMFGVSQRGRKAVGEERAAAAAKTAEKTLNQAGSAFRSFRSRAKKSLDK